MISFFIICFWNNRDKEADMRLTLDSVIGIAILEVFMFLLQVGLYGSNSVFSIVLPVFGTVYMCSTAVIDYLTGYVYCFGHFVMLGILFIYKIISMEFSISWCIFTAFYLLFLISCERVGAFSHGDSEYLAVSYIYFGCSIIESFALEFMLGVMLMSAGVFGIFRKYRARKEVLAFTPMIVFSEYIMMLILRFMAW